MKSIVKVVALIGVFVFTTACTTHHHHYHGGQGKGVQKPVRYMNPQGDMDRQNRQFQGCGRRC